MLCVAFVAPTTSSAADVIVPEPALSSTPVEQGYRDFSYGNSVYHRPTAEKPQSKLWWNDGIWWGCMWDASEGSYRIHRLDVATQSWSSVGPNADNNTSAIVDVKWDGTFLYILAHPFEASGDFKLHSYTYDAASEAYTLRSGFPVTPANGNAEAATLDKDSAGKLWITWADGGDVMIVASQSDDTSWGTPFVLPVQGSSAKSDDISSVAAFDGKIGVMWSNQNDAMIYFAIHNDGDPDTTWQPREDAVGGPGEGAIADDHLNFALTCDAGANVYAVFKTSIGLPGEPRVMLTHRDPSGTWADYVVGRDEDDHTRPIVVIDEENRQIYVFAKSDTGDNSIRMKTSDLDNIDFGAGPGQMFIQSSSENDVNNPTSTKQTLSGQTDLLVLASDGTARVYMHNFIDLPGSGSSTAPDIAASPTSHDFGDVDVGSNVSQTIRVFNQGDATLDVTATTASGGDAGEFAVTAGSAPFSVAPGDSHDVTVRFAPVDTGAESGMLDISSNDPDEPTVSIALSGNGTGVPGPDIDVLPASRDFGDVLVNDSSTQTFWVRNAGKASLNVSGFGLSGTDASLFTTTSEASSFTLAAGDSQRIDVTFTPTSVGANSATLSFSSDDPDENPLNVGLSGRGALPTSPEIAVSPGLLDWGLVLNSSIVSQSIQVHNDGDANLEVTSTALVGGDAALFSVTTGSGPFSVTPGDSHEVVIEFAPTTLGAKFTTLEIASNDADETILNVLLRGESTNVVSTGGVVTLEETVTGGAMSSLSVSTASSAQAVPHHLYLASIASKNLEDVASVEGMGMDWTLVAKQCGGRGQTGTEVWMARSATPSTGVVTATFTAPAGAAVIALARYAGAHDSTPLGVPVTANTIGVAGPCDDTGVDNTAYSVPILATADAGVIFAAIAKRRKTHTPGDDWTQQVLVEAGSGGSIAGAVCVDSTISPPGNVTLSGTFDGAVDWALVAVEIIPAPGETSSAAGPLADASIGAAQVRVARTFGVPLLQLVAPEPTRLRLTVHDARGRLVETLWNGNVASGLSQFEWTRAGSRLQVPAGIYFVRARTTNRVLTTKLMVLH